MMKNKVIYSILALAVILIGNSCSEYDMLSYKNDPALFFFNKAGTQQDSISHSFFFLPKEQVEDELGLIVLTVGELSDIDRPISIVQTNKGKEDAAIAGVHYLPFDDPKVKERMVVPAGKNQVKIPIIILRDPSLDDKHVRLELTFEKNEYFKLGVVADSLNVFTITTTTQATKPTIWDTRWFRLFGATWGTVKMRFIIDETKYTDWETAIDDVAYSTYLEDLVKKAFRKHNASGKPPLKEANGDLVVFKPGW